MIQILYSIFIYFFEMLVAFAFFQKNYKKRLPTPYILLIGTIIFTLSAFLFLYVNNAAISISVFLLINFLFGIVCFKISINSCIIQCAFLDVIMYLTELIPIFLLSSIFKIPTNTYEDNFVIYIVYSLISKMLYLIISQIFSVLIKKENFHTFKIRYFLPLFIFPILTLVTASVFLFLALEINIPNIYQTMIFIISTLFLISSIFIFIHFQTLLEKERKINELESEKKINIINKTYMDILEHQNDEFQMMFHDTKHHYLALSNMESTEDVKKYIENLYTNLENQNKVRLSNNRIIDVIINKYIVLCKTKNIKFNYEVKTADLRYIDNVELSAILNNALDNAVEAAETSAEKIIELSLRHINNMDLLSIVNSCDAAPNHKHGKLKTIKEQPESHGFGSRIIERHTKANNGTYEWFYDDTEKKFHLTLVFQK